MNPTNPTTGSEIPDLDHPAMTITETVDLTREEANRRWPIIAEAFGLNESPAINSGEPTVLEGAGLKIEHISGRPTGSPVILVTIPVTITLFDQAALDFMAQLEGADDDR